MLSDKNIKILIVENESVIAFAMKAMLSELGFIHCIITNTEKQAQTLIERDEFGLILLDINLNKGEEGLNLAKICHVKSIPFLYVTSYTNKATIDRAIETAPGAYIIKPFLPSDLYAAIELTLASKTKPNYNYISINDGNIPIRLETNELLYAKAEGIYIEIVTLNKKYLIRNSLKKLMEILPEGNFIQTHRSFVVNNTHLTKISSTHIELGEYEITLSRTFKEDLVKMKLN